MTTIQSIAYKYRSFGWNVLPLLNNEKGMVPSWTKPVGYGWLEWQDKKPNDEEFKRLFSYSDITGIALMTGKTSNILMLDYDLYSPDAPKIEITSTLISKTASGGKHFYYRYEDIKEMRIPGLEIKNASLDVLPPSQAKNKMGKIGRYEWISKDLRGITLLPESIKKLFWSVSKKERVDVRELVKSSEGNRHNNLLQIALATFNRFPQSEWDIAKSFIRKTASEFTPPNPIPDTESTIRDAIFRVSSNPKEKFIEQKSLQNTQQIPSPISMAQAYVERLEERRKEAVAPKTGYVELDESITGWTPGFVYVLAGDTGVGKTAFACNLAVRCSKQGGKVLYYSIETGNEIIDYMASVRLNKPYRAILDEDLNFDDPNIKIYRHEVLTLPDLKASLKKNKDNFNLAIVDNIGFFEEKSNVPTQAQLELMRELSKLALDSKIAILIIAHFNKPPPGGKNIVSMDRISGSKAFQNYAKGVLLLKRDKMSEDKNDPQYADNGFLIVAKSKRGASKFFRLIFTDASAFVRTDMDFAEGTLERQGF